MTGKTLMDELATPEEIAAAWATWHERHGGKLGPGPAFREAIGAALAVRCATIRSLQERAERQWQPIETAPKDGSDVLLYCVPSSRSRFGALAHPIKACQFRKGNWVTVGSDVPVANPTRWQPLPSPPLLSLQSGEEQNDG